MRRVRIGTCGGPAEAALVRAALDAHDIPVLINAEQHASMLGGLGGAFVPLHIYVDEADATEAAALLRDLRASGDGDAVDEAELIAAALASDPDRAPAPTDGDDALAPAPGDPDDDADDHALVPSRADRRRQIALLLFGVYAGAVTIPFVIGRPVLVSALLAVAFGVLVLYLRAHRPRPPELPAARLHRGAARRDR